jgi:hypothetical protein
MAKQLKTSVHIDGVWYRPGDRAGDQIPDDAVEQISNPKVWEYTEGDEEPAEPDGDLFTRVKLVRRVDVDGNWYGPGDDLPEDVARKISNPKVWEGGKAPQFDTAAEDEQPPAAPEQDSAVAEPAGQPDGDTTGGDSRPARRGRRASS